VVYLACSYIPYEIPLAAGMSAARGIFEGPLSAMEGYLPRDFCPYARAFIRQYGDNDVVAVAESCDAMRRVYDVLKYWNLARCAYFVDVPRTYDPEAVSFYAEELRGFASKLLDSVPLPCDSFPERLELAIKGMNRIRRELSGVFDLVSERQLLATKATQLAISINQLLACFPSLPDPSDSGFSPKHSSASGMFDNLIEEIKELINQALSEPAHLRQRRSGIPVGVSGTCLLDLSLIECIENAGLDVVFIDSCLPSRTYAFYVDNETTSDPFYALAEAYLRKMPCPRMFRGKERIRRLHELASDYDAQGLIYFAPKFCDQACYDFIEIKHGLKSLGSLPVLFLEGQYGVGRAGQTLTRIAAFREMLEGTQILKAGKQQ